MWGVQFRLEFTALITYIHRRTKGTDLKRQIKYREITCNSERE